MDPKDNKFKEFDFFGKLAGAAINVNDLPNSKWKTTGLSLTDTFTNVVDTMRDAGKVPLPPINDLMTLFWDLVGKKTIPVGMSPLTKTLAFISEMNRERKMVGAILCPVGWGKMVKDDPCMQMGAVVFVASQSRDFYNFKFQEYALAEAAKKKGVMVSMPGLNIGDADGNPVIRRARAYEAEFLHWVKRNEPRHPFNNYQRGIMADFPDGLKSLPADQIYVSKGNP